MALGKLRQQQELVETLEVDIATKRTAWKRKIETHKVRIHAEFEQQKKFLAEEEQRQLQKLEKDEREQLRLLGEAEVELAQNREDLQELIAELEQRSRSSGLELLQVRWERLAL